MEIEYSNELKGIAFAYRFTEDEKKEIVIGLKTRIRAIEQKIERIKNHKKNEGQAKYEIKIDSLRYFREDLEDIIKNFS